MKNLIFTTALIVCFYFLSSCENDTDKNIQSTQLNDIPVSQELKDFAKKLTNKNYIFKNLTFVEGTLDEALLQAKQQNKYLHVVTSLDDCPSCDLPLKILDLNRNNVIQKETFNKFLFYKCNFSVDENKYLFWANNSIASPKSFLFKGSKIINFSRGMQELGAGVLLTNINTINTASISNRHNLKGQDAINFINKQIEAYKAYKNPNSSKQELALAYNSIKQTINMEETYFNHYLSLQLQKRLGLTNNKKTVSQKENKFNDDEYSEMLFEDLNSIYIW